MHNGVGVQSFIHQRQQSPLLEPLRLELTDGIKVSATKVVEARVLMDVAQ